MTRILLVEDEGAIAQTVEFALRAAGFEVAHALTGRAALRLATASPFDLAILDVGLPDIDGFALCAELRRLRELPVIFLTARAGEADRVHGLELGGDDYIAKPFSLRELVARVRAVLRRGQPPAPASGFAHDADGHRIHYRGRLLDLTRYEYRLLAALLQRPGAILTRAQLLDRAWGPDSDSTDRTVDTHIKTLRAKLREIDPDSDPIRTQRGLGYSLEQGLMRIGLRILIGTFAIVALTALLLSQVFLAQVKPGVRQAMEDTLVDTANVLAELASDDLLAGRIADGRFAARVRGMHGRDPGAAIWGFAKRRTNYRIYVTDARGIVVFDSSGVDVGADYSRWNDVYLTLRGRYGARSSLADPADPDSTVMHVAAPIRDAAGAIVGSLTVAKPNRVIAPFIERSQDIVLRWGALLLGFALLVGIATATWLSRQLGALRRYAQAVTAGERAALPRTAGEFAELGQALETMRTRLEGKQYVERYVHALTHEMKSPLAAIRASAELLEQPLPPADQARFAEAIRSQGERLTQMIDRLLALAEVEHRQRLEAPQPVAVATLLQAVAEDAAPRLALRGQRLALRVDGAPQVQGDAFLLRQALGNLVENAADFAPAGSAIELSADIDGDRVQLKVCDDGPGVPDYALGRVFDRFYSLPRPDGGHRSSGLGLCFVAQVADLHGGSAALANRPEGGACATLRLPLGR